MRSVLAILLIIASISCFAIEGWEAEYDFKDLVKDRRIIQRIFEKDYPRKKETLSLSLNTSYNIDFSSSMIAIKNRSFLFNAKTIVKSGSQRTSASLYVKNNSFSIDNLRWFHKLKTSRYSAYNKISNEDIGIENEVEYWSKLKTLSGEVHTKLRLYKSWGLKTITDYYRLKSKFEHLNNYYLSVGEENFSINLGISGTNTENIKPSAYFVLSNKLNYNLRVGFRKRIIAPDLEKLYQGTALNWGSLFNQSMYNLKLVQSDELKASFEYLAKGIKQELAWRMLRSSGKNKIMWNGSRSYINHTEYKKKQTVTEVSYIFRTDDFCLNLEYNDDVGDFKPRFDITTEIGTRFIAFTQLILKAGYKFEERIKSKKYNYPLGGAELKILRFYPWSMKIGFEKSWTHFDNTILRNNEKYYLLISFEQGNYETLYKKNR